MKSMIYEDEYYYVCHDGRELHHIRTEKKQQEGYEQIFEVYDCSDCSGCEHKEKYLYKYYSEKDPDKNKTMKINERWEDTFRQDRRTFWRYKKMKISGSFITAHLEKRIGNFYCIRLAGI